MNWHTELWSEDGLVGLSIARTDIHLELYLLADPGASDVLDIDPKDLAGWEKMHEGMEEFHYRRYLGSMDKEDLGLFLKRTLMIVADEALAKERKEDA